MTVINLRLHILFSSVPTATRTEIVLIGIRLCSQYDMGDSEIVGPENVELLRISVGDWKDITIDRYQGRKVN